MQQYADIYLRQSHSKCFGCHSTQVDILPKYPHNCRNNHSLQNPHIHTPTHYKTHTYTQQHITKQVKTTKLIERSSATAIYRLKESL